jgi:type IV secretory pathway VirB2 component (pilin)
MIAAAIPQASLSDVPPVSTISNAVNWISDLLFGPLATAIAVIAIAWIGIAMLSGRIDIRRGLSVIFGCFLLFGARGVADGLTSSEFNENQQSISTVSPPPNFPIPPPTAANNTNAFDPYAGAAVTRTGQ